MKTYGWGVMRLALIVVMVGWSLQTLMAQAVNASSGAPVMDADVIARITASVVVLAQLGKSMGVRGFGALGLAVVVTAIGVGLWAYSSEFWTRSTIFQIFTGYCVVLSSAAGVFNLINQAGDKVMGIKQSFTGGTGN